LRGLDRVATPLDRLDLTDEVLLREILVRLRGLLVRRQRRLELLEQLTRGRELAERPLARRALGLDRIQKRLAGARARRVHVREEVGAVRVAALERWRARELRLDPPQLQALELELAANRGRVDRVHRRVEPHEHLALLDALALVDENRADDPGLRG